MDKIAAALVLKGDQFLKKNGPRKFHLEAARLLSEANVHKKFSMDKFVELSFKKGNESIQSYRAFEFSDLPLTLARGKNCFIDLYVWRRRPTTIHNHHFVGAFQCLVGNNVDLSFSFKTRKKIGKFHSMGELKLDHSQKIENGMIQPIDLQDKFIHQNHHHHDLTVNLCFRTPDFPKTNIANFLYSGLRYEKESALLMRVERVFRLLAMTELDLNKIKLSDDEAMSFLIQSYGTTSGNPSFNKLRSVLNDQVKKKFKISVDDLLDQHESEIDIIQSNYD